MRVLCVEAGWRRAKGVDDRLRRLLGRVGVAVAGEALTTCDGGGAEAVETHAQRAPALGLERRDAQVACAQASHVMRHLVRGVGIPLEDSERHPAAAAVDASVDRVAADPLQPPLARSVGAPRLTAALLVAFEVQDLPEGPLVLPVRLEVPPRAPLDRIHLAGLRFLLERLPASLERGTRSAAAEVAREELPAKVRRAPPPLAPDRRVLPRRRLAPLRRDVREEAVAAEVGAGRCRRRRFFVTSHAQAVSSLRATGMRLAVHASPMRTGCSSLPPTPLGASVGGTVNSTGLLLPGRSM